MIIDELAYQIQQVFGLEPTPEQAQAIGVFCRFVTDRDAHAVMILRGSAGTGKTSLAGAFVRTLLKLQQKVMLMAPTGRAAKVFSLNSGQPAFTIHRKIYRQKTFTGDMSGFTLNDNLHTDMLFMVDEASMVANAGFSDSAFGSGRLLDDLVEYVYSGRNCRLLLIGDHAQLPPVGEEESPALSANYLRGYGLRVHECTLNEVLRQSNGSGILYNATAIRRLLDCGELPRIRFRGFADICMVPGNELIEQLNSSYSAVGIDETMVVTRSNKRANIYNRGIRSSILDREEELNTGDMVMIVKNNYYYSRGEGIDVRGAGSGERGAKSDVRGAGSEERGARVDVRGAGSGERGAKLEERGAEGEERQQLDFIANGDRAKILRVRNVRELYGFRFADALLQFPDYDDYELQATILLDSLNTEAPALTPQQNEQLFRAVMEDYAYLRTKADRIKHIKEDPYYNALQIKYAYAVTCHKAQGGQWAHIYIDQGYMTDDMLTPDYIHWLYTAFTRATEKLFLVNWPVNQVTS